jgi:hypothetical protein
MSPAVLGEMVLLVALEAFLLFALSRLLFACVLRSLAGRARGGGGLIRWLRLPGNLVHEVSHAAGYLLCGFRVKRLETTVSDPEGRGLCEPGAPWAAAAIPWLATGAAAVLPLVFGALFLRGLAMLLGVRFVNGGHGLEGGAVGLLVATIRETLHRMDLLDWRAWVFLYLGFSVGAELAPSASDFRRCVAPLTATAVVLAGMTFYLGLGHAASPAWQWYSRTLAGALQWLFSLLGFAVLTTALVAAVTVLPGLAWRALKYLVRLL